MDNEDLLGVKKEKKEKTEKTAREALVIPQLSFCGFFAKILHIKSVVIRNTALYGGAFWS